MDVGSFADKILTSTATWVVTGVIGPILIAALPSIRGWLKSRPATLASVVGVFSAVVVSGIFWTLSERTPPQLKIGFRTSGPILFTDVRQAAPIPGSSGAIFCGLTYVDDDGPDALCEVSRDGTEWFMKTGLGGDFNACKAMCLFAEETKT